MNCSPKGMDTFRILSAREVAYLDLTGSGVETIAHSRENGRIVAIEQDGWIIRLPEVFDISARPRRLLLERPGASNAPAVDLRLIIDEPG